MLTQLAGEMSAMLGLRRCARMDGTRPEPPGSTLPSPRGQDGSGAAGAGPVVDLNGAGHAAGPVHLLASSVAHVA